MRKISEETTLKAGIRVVIWQSALQSDTTAMLGKERMRAAGYNEYLSSVFVKVPSDMHLVQVCISLQVQ